MEPTLHEGDLLLVSWGAAPRAGDVAVVALPPDASGAPRPVSVKRLVTRDPADPSRWWIGSDNAMHGVSSAVTGTIPGRDVLAVVVARVAPRPGRLPPQGAA